MRPRPPSGEMEAGGREENPKSKAEPPSRGSRALRDGDKGPESLELSPRITWGPDLCSLEPPSGHHWSPTWSRAQPAPEGQEASAVGGGAGGRRGGPLTTTAKKGHRGDPQQRRVCNSNQHTCSGSRRLCLAPSGLDFSSLFLTALLPSLPSVFPSSPHFYLSFLRSMPASIPFLPSLFHTFPSPSSSPSFHSFPITKSHREKPGRNRVMTVDFTTTPKPSHNLSQRCHVSGTKSVMTSFIAPKIRGEDVSSSLPQSQSLCP